MLACVDLKLNRDEKPLLPDHDQQVDTSPLAPHVRPLAFQKVSVERRQRVRIDVTGLPAHRCAQKRSEPLRAEAVRPLRVEAVSEEMTVPYLLPDHGYRLERAIDVPRTVKFGEVRIVDRKSLQRCEHRTPPIRFVQLSA